MFRCIFRQALKSQFCFSLLVCCIFLSIGWGAWRSDLFSNNIATPIESLDLSDSFKTQIESPRLSELNLAEPSSISPSQNSIEQKLQQHIKYTPHGENIVGLIQIDQKNSQISEATWIYVKNALDYYKKIRPIFIILELNTPGGEVFSAQKISDALKEIDTQYDIPVVCFINNWAISAGAMLAYSSRFIAVTKDASMGAAEPLQMGEAGKYETASEKVNSALRTDFANRASFFDRNPFIAEAMVDKDIILVNRDGKIIKLLNESDVRQQGANPDKIISSKGKLLTLNREDMMNYGVADIYLPPQKIAPITEDMKSKGVWPASKMLLFTAPFFKDIPNAKINLYKMDWKTQFLVLLSSPAVTSLLFLGMILGFYIEINTPGFGLPGSLALLCLGLIMISSFALEVANILEVVLLIMGLVFIALDLFLIPTFGILGIVGIIFAVIGLFGMMLPAINDVNFELDTQTFNAAGEVFIRRLGWLSGTLVAAVVLMIGLGKYVMPKFSRFHRLVLEGNEESADKGYIAGAIPSTLPRPGVEGVVVSTLRPAGKIEVAGDIYDAMTSGEFIEKGTPIRIVKLEGSVIIVDEVESEIAIESQNKTDKRTDNEIDNRTDNEIEGGN